MAQSDIEDITTCLFLLGKTGNGKSQTGNTILGRKAFISSDSGESATFGTSSAYGAANDQILKVVDGPGLFDTRRDAEGNFHKAELSLSQAFSHCTRGFDALILVLKYGDKYTPEEAKTLTILRNMFGPNFIREFGIVIFTHGDEFELSVKDCPEKTFDVWCKEQTGQLRQILDECGHRVVLFDNMSPGKRDVQVTKLLSYVKTIGKRYTDTMFKEINEARLSSCVAMTAIELDEDIQRDVCLLSAMMKPDSGPIDIESLNLLLSRLENALSTVDDTFDTVKTLKLGIQFAKERKYGQAHKCFQEIEDLGKKTVEEFCRQHVVFIVHEHMNRRHVFIIRKRP